ncbi:hypothetical protein GDO81_028621, partial [Engystomops pustulosus]
LESADGLCCVLTTPCLTQQSVNVLHVRQEVPVMRRKKPFNWKSMKRVSLAAEEPETSLETDDSFLSYGLRQSIASYLSLAEDGEGNFTIPNNEPKEKRNRRSCIFSRNSVISDCANYMESYR